MWNIFLSLLLITSLAAQTDTLDSYQLDEYHKYGSEYLRYLKAYNDVKFFIDKDLVQAKKLLGPMYNASYALLPKTPRYLGSYYNTKARIELQSGNQIAASNSFLISIDYFKQEHQDNPKSNSTELSYEYIDLANVYFSLELYDKAIPFYKDAAAAFIKAGENLGLATSLNNLGLIFEKRGQYDSALAFFNNGLAARKKVQKSDTCYYFGHSLKYIARVKLEQGDHDSCLAVLKSAEKYTKMTSYYGAKYVLVEIYNLFARCYLESGFIEQGMEYYDMAIQTAETNYQNQILCETYLSIAEHYFSIRNYIKADHYAANALILAQSKNFFNEKLKSVLLMGKIHSLSGDKLKAIHYIDQYDSLSKARESFIAASGLEALSESIRSRETIYNHVTENKLLQQENRTLILLLLSIFIALASLLSFFYLKYRIKTRIEKALLKTKNELLKINAVKDRLFSILAHDLKSPFTALIGFSELLSEDFERMEKQEVKKLITVMQQVSKNTYSLLENLLDWSRIQSDEINCKPELLPLAEELAPTLNLLADTAKRKNVSLTCKIDAKHMVLVDRHMLNTIMRNILGNAIKFSHSDSEVRITSAISGELTEIAVCDTGIGMDKEVVDKILHSNSFYSTKGTQEEKGTGLGIMLCKEFIDKNNGILRIKSTPGEGSVFTIAFRNKE